MNNLLYLLMDLQLGMAGGEGNEHNLPQLTILENTPTNVPPQLNLPLSQSNNSSNLEDEILSERSKEKTQISSISENSITEKSISTIPEIISEANEQISSQPNLESQDITQNTDIEKSESVVSKKAPLATQDSYLSASSDSTQTTVVEMNLTSEESSEKQEFNKDDIISLIKLDAEKLEENSSMQNLSAFDSNEMDSISLNTENLEKAFQKKITIVQIPLRHNIPRRYGTADAYEEDEEAYSSTPFQIFIIGLAIFSILYFVLGRYVFTSFY